MLQAQPLIDLAEPEVPQLDRRRRSGLPDQSSYADTGCELATSCLACPLPRCKYDDPHWRQRNDLQARDARIVELRASGHTVKQIASILDVSDRTTYRVLLREKRAEEKGEDSECARQDDAVMTLEELADWRPVTATAR